MWGGRETRKGRQTGARGPFENYDPSRGAHPGRLTEPELHSLSNQWYRQLELQNSLTLASFSEPPRPGLSAGRCRRPTVQWGPAPQSTNIHHLPACVGARCLLSCLCHFPMKRELALRRWAAPAYVLVLFCHSFTLSMALSVHQARYMHSARYVLRQTKVTSVRAMSSVTSPRRKGRRRGRTTAMLHSDAYAGSPSTSAQVQPSPLPTAMDRALPFGRCVGVALPVALTDDVMKAAEEELLPEEMSYCAGLPKTLQVLGAGGSLEKGKDEDGAVVVAIRLPIVSCKV